MQKERFNGERGVPLLTLSEVVEQAKRDTLLRGEHPPTLIAQGTFSTLPIEMVGLADTPSVRQKQFFSTGTLIAQQGHIGILQQTFLISEVWIKPIAVPNQLIDRPITNPDGIEALWVSRWYAEVSVYQHILLEMTRTADRLVSDLIPLSLRHLESTNPNALIRAFVDGYWDVMRPRVN